MWQKDLKASDRYARNDLPNVYTQMWINPTAPILSKSCAKLQWVNYLDEVAVLGIREAEMSKGMCVGA